VHLFFRRPEGCPATSKYAALGPGVDVKANGYAVLSPSRHPSGGRYSWHAPPSAEIADAPDRVIDLPPACHRGRTPASTAITPPGRPGVP
jgi:hypothetical protein